jgi:hypothetical protein
MYRTSHTVRNIKSTLCLNCVKQTCKQTVLFPVVYMTALPDLPYSIRVLLKEGCSPRVQSGSEAQQLGFGHEALDQGMVHIVRLASPSMSTSTVATPVLSTKPSR